MSSFMRRSDSSDVPPTPGEISGPLMAQYLMALLGGSGRRRGGVGGEDPFAGLFGPSAFGPENGRWGDYAFSQEALDQIISEIMENSNTHRPVAATDEITDKLPREVLEEGCKYRKAGLVFFIFTRPYSPAVGEGLRRVQGTVQLAHGGP
jgi:E3 ubiquitin-protein ligase RNF115/126